MKSNPKQNLAYLALGLGISGCSEITPSKISYPVIEDKTIVETTIEKEGEQENKAAEKTRDEKISIEDYLEKNGIEPEYEYTTKWWEYPLNITGGFVLNVGLHE